MIVCPVCEHQQAAGFECDVCGKDLGASLGDGDLIAPLADDIPRLPDLEQTGAEQAKNVPVEPMPGLEANIGAAGTPQVPVQRMAELETFAAPVGEVPVAPMPDLSLDRAEFVGQKAAAPGAQVQCRYCGNVQAKGAICERCGMRLPRGAAAGAKGPRAPTALVRCKACGTPGVEGERCKGQDCGRVVEPRGAG